MPSSSTGGQPATEFGDTLVLKWYNSGSCMPEKGYLQRLVDLCRSNGATSIFDEVVTGFRIAFGGARKYLNIIPYLSIYGKAMAGGFTMGAVEIAFR